MPPEEQQESRNGGVFPSKEHQFKRGQSGNPGGRPKGESLVAALRRRLAEEHNGKTLGEILVEALIKGAVQGKPQHIKEVLDRVEGKVTDKLDLNASGPLTIKVVYDDERSPKQ